MSNPHLVKSNHSVRIVCIGGGTGLHVMLSGLRERLPDAELSAVVTMMDSGGSTGRLRDEFGYLPPGDIRRALIALSEAPLELRSLMQHRFKAKGSSLHDHVVGNILLTALKDLNNGSEYDAIEAMARILRIRGNVYPVTLTNCHLVAKLEDGSVIRGETNIDIPKHNPKLRITAIGLEPDAVIFEKTADVLKSAEYIIIGPGDLYTSIMPNIIVQGFADTLKSAKENGARIIYVTNTMTKNGETNGFSSSDFLEIVQDAINNTTIDAIIANNGVFTQEQLAAYAAENAEPVACDVNEKKGLLVVAEDLTNDNPGKESFARHDPKKLAKAVEKAIMRLSLRRILEENTTGQATKEKSTEQEERPEAM